MAEIIEFEKAISGAIPVERSKKGDNPKTEGERFAERHATNERILERLNQAWEVAGKWGIKLDAGETEIIAKNLHKLIQKHWPDTAELCAEVFHATKEDSSKKLDKYTLSDTLKPTQYEKKRSRLVRHIARGGPYLRMVECMAARQGKESEHYFADLFRGTQWAKREVVYSADDSIPELYYELAYVLQKMARAVYDSEGLKEYYEILTRGHYSYDGVFEQGDRSAFIQPRPYLQKDKWDYDNWCPRLGNVLGGDAACNQGAIIAVPISRSYMKPVVLPTELFEFQHRMTKENAPEEFLKPESFPFIQITSCMELYLQLADFSVVDEEHEIRDLLSLQQRFKTWVAFRKDEENTNHQYAAEPQIVFGYDDSSILFELDGRMYEFSIWDAYQGENKLKINIPGGENEFYNYELSPANLKNWFGNLAERYTLGNGAIYRGDFMYSELEDYIPWQSHEAYWESPYFKNQDMEVGRQSMAEMMFANLFLPIENEASIEGELKRIARQKKAILMQGHERYVRQLGEEKKRLENRWLSNTHKE